MADLKKFSLQCPECGMVIHQVQMRCPRCNASLKELLECNGDCKKCKNNNC